MDKKSIVYLIIVLIVFGVALTLIYYFSNSQVEVDVKFTHTPKANDEKIAPRAILTLQTDSQMIISGQPVAVKVMLDTQNNPIDGVDLYLSYSNLEPSSDLLDKSTSIFSNLMGPTVVREEKTIRLSALSEPGQSFTGQGEVVTLNFNAVAAGPAKVSLNFEPGSTIDCNVSYFEAGEDILWQVSDLDLVIQ